MDSVLSKIVAWLVRKLAIPAVIAGLTLVGYALWLSSREPGDFKTKQETRLNELKHKRSELLSGKQAVEKRLVDLQADIEAQQERVKRAQKVIDLLRDMDSWWDRLRGDAQAKANAEQLKRMEEIKTQALAQIEASRRALPQTHWEKDGIEIELGQVTRQIAEVEASKSPVVHYLRAAWRAGKGYVIVVLAMYFFGPMLWARFIWKRHRV